MKRLRERNSFWLEAKRQSVHAAGALFAVSAYFLGAFNTLILSGITILIATALGYLRSRRTGIFRHLEDSLHNWVMGFERPGELPLNGLITFAAGVFIVSLIFPVSVIVPSVLVLAFGDSLSTLVGRLWGRNPLFYNEKKSWEGSGAFFFAALAVLYFFVNPMKAVAIASLAAVVEGMPDVDDNITVPFAVAVFLSI